jgi:hypothetical protein
LRPLQDTRQPGRRQRADVAPQYLDERQVDQTLIHLLPILTGRGARRFGPRGPSAEPAPIQASPSGSVTNLRFRVVGENPGHRAALHSREPGGRHSGPKARCISIVVRESPTGARKVATGGQPTTLHNAVMESFGARVQVALLNRRRWRTRVELANALFEYLEIFPSHERRHSSLATHTPVEYEILHQTRQPLGPRSQKPGSTEQ